MATGKNLCPYSDGLDNLGKSGKAWGNTHTKNLYVTGNAEIQTLKVGGETDIQGYVKKVGGTMTGNLTVPTVIGNLNGTANIAKKDTDSHDIISSYLSRNNDANYPVSMVSSLDNAIREGLYNVSLSTSLTADKSYKRGRLLTLNNQLDKNNAQNQIFQTFFSIDGDILTRHKIDSNSWTDWIKLMTVADNSEIDSKLNELRLEIKKRTTPSKFDDDEMTLIMGKQTASGTLTLSQPYTNFDGLYIVYSSDSNYYRGTHYISTWELQYRIKCAKDDNKDAAVLFSGDDWWYVSKNSTTTSLITTKENCVIHKIYGIKFK